MQNGRPLRPYHGAASGVEIADLSWQYAFTHGFSGVQQLNLLFSV